MKAEIRCLNEKGILTVAQTLDELRDDPDQDFPSDLLVEPELSEIVGGRLEPPPGGFSSRWVLGVWLYRELQRALPDSSWLRHPGTWTWLAMFLFDIIRPSGTRVYEDARYILNKDDYRRRYRHLVAGPYYVFAAHDSEPHVVRGLLATEPHAPGDLYEQFASRKELITSAAVMDLVTRMYFDSETEALKRGASASARRLAEVLMQYDVTYDFASITTERLLGMMPHEFQRFLKGSRPEQTA